VKPALALLVALGTCVPALTACSPTEAPEGNGLNYDAPDGFWAYTGPDRVLVTEVDASFEMGVYELFDPSTGERVGEAGAIHSDALAGCAGPYAVVVNRLQQDNLQFVDASTGATVGQWSTGNGSNPYNAVFWGDEAFVTLYEEPDLLVARWDTGETIDRIDLSPWADADGIPEASRLFSAEGLLWVTLERMDRDGDWRPAGGSRLLGIEPSTHEVVSEIALPADNPASDWNVAGAIARVAASGAWWNDDGSEIALDGGLVSVELSKAGSGELLLSESTVGRNIWAALTDGSLAWLSTYDASWQNRIELWDLASGTQVGDLGVGVTFGWGRDRDGSVWAGDNTGAGLVHLAWNDGASLGRSSTVDHPTDLAVCEVD
jgi:hypothetical protein